MFEESATKMEQKWNGVKIEDRMGKKMTFFFFL